MTTHNKLKNRILRIATLVVGAVTLFSSCKINDDSYNYPDVAAVSAINAVPGSPGLDIGLDQNKLNSGWNEKFAFTDYLYYRNAFPGKREVSVYRQSGENISQPLFKGPVDLESGKYYTLFVVGESPVEIFQTEDKFAANEDGIAKVRFINLSPNSETVSFTVEGIDSLNFENKAYKQVQEFKTYQVGKTYKITLSQGAKKQVIDFEFKPDNRRVYTIWAKGLVGNEEPNKAFGYQITRY